MENNSQGSTRFERVVYADNGLAQDLMPAFDRLIRVKGQQLLVELDNWLSAQESIDADSSRARFNVNTGVGIYHFIEEE
jgi:hypothetical protein